MSDRIFFTLAALVAVAMIAFAFTWPTRPGRTAYNLSAVEAPATPATPGAVP